jgi:hypothetical protein
MSPLYNTVSGELLRGNLSAVAEENQAAGATVCAACGARRFRVRMEDGVGSVYLGPSHGFVECFVVLIGRPILTFPCFVIFKLCL